MTEVGGNILNKVNFKESELIFAEDAYTYYWKRLSPGEKLKLDQLQSFSVYILQLKAGSHIIAKECSTHLNQGDLLQAEGQSVELSSDSPAEILVAGTKTCLAKDNCILVSKASTIKKVTKPWGHELWLNGEHPGYAFKQLLVKQGYRTSLQYHRIKRETIVLFSGEANLHYKSNPLASIDTPAKEDISQHLIQAPICVDVFPNLLHRYEALTDIVFYEVSTPHLDDVVRVSDDSNRPDGRIDNEHA